MASNVNGAISLTDTSNTAVTVADNASNSNGTTAALGLGGAAVSTAKTVDQAVDAINNTSALSGKVRASNDNGKLRIENLALGMSIFIVGLAKKVLIADNLSPMVGPAFSAGVHPQLTEAWLATLAYTFQLYFDFSGYSDMAIGLSLLFGVRLPLNFNSPYKARNISDFWRRWHITLSRFLRD